MKIRMLKPVTYMIIVMVGATMFFSSCEKDPEPMDLPPAESLVMDLTIFPSDDVVKSMVVDTSNWAVSATTVFLWQTVVALNVAVPITAYAAAFNNTPVYLGDYTWEWSYSVVVGFSTYTARLVGTRLNNEEYSMEMYLSLSAAQRSFTDFKWFDGVIRYDGTAATWTLRQSYEKPADYLEVDYTKDFVTNESTIRYTVIDPQNTIYESYIKYGIVPDADFDAYYTINYEDALTSIEWNITSSAGRVMSSGYFGDSDWHCWDSQLMNVDCGN